MSGERRKRPPEGRGSMASLKATPHRTQHQPDLPGPMAAPTMVVQGADNIQYMGANKPSNAPSLGLAETNTKTTISVNRRASQHRAAEGGDSTAPCKDQTLVTQADIVPQRQHASVDRRSNRRRLPPIPKAESKHQSARGKFMTAMQFDQEGRVHEAVEAYKATLSLIEECLAEYIDDGHSGRKQVQQLQKARVNISTRLGEITKELQQTDPMEIVLTDERIAVQSEEGNSVEAVVSDVNDTAADLNALEDALRDEAVSGQYSGLTESHGPTDDIFEFCTLDDDIPQAVWAAREAAVASVRSAVVSKADGKPVEMARPRALLAKLGMLDSALNSHDGSVLLQVMQSSSLC